MRQLREMTGAGMMDCRKALEETGGDVDRAVTVLRERGLAKAAKRASRETNNGVVEAYLHRTSEDYPPQVGAMVEVDCETDFVAKGDDFRKLARELALQIAASGPRYVSREEVPAEILEEERSLYRRRAEQDGKPAQAIEKIVDGQLEAFFKEVCLLEQPYVREPKIPVKEVVGEAVAKLQENIVVRRFSRFSVKEG
ncbi:translation elongation factor Ts [Candidatus Nephthysia bennettiae]|uniref:Elongation factor Ts n=1 Tax=Candidatus Nephthysia bennettiae TaxID=3127016 RepID=A0A934N589_9BACT|nr:elongation factor Ts [Candidatus Dormibacteraeota bacterium]MBJ7611142.1 elongation factor Ts [Candidatus Dormibacteraeota bacterium]